VPLLEKVRIELFIPDLPDPIYRSIVRPLEGSVPMIRLKGQLEQAKESLQVTQPR
jgi:hypothetical protein